MSRRTGGDTVPPPSIPDTRLSHTSIARAHYRLDCYPCPADGGGQNVRDAIFTRYAGGFAGLFDMPLREAWVEANELVEDSDVEWAYLRTGDSYAERLGDGKPAASGRISFAAHGSC